MTSLQSFYDDNVTFELSSIFDTEHLYTHGFEQVIFDLEEALEKIGKDYAISRCFEARKITSDFTQDAVDFTLKYHANLAESSNTTQVIYERALFKTLVEATKSDIEGQIEYIENEHYQPLAHDACGVTGRI